MTENDLNNGYQESVNYVHTQNASLNLGTTSFNYGYYDSTTITFNDKVNAVVALLHAIPKHSRLTDHLEDKAIELLRLI